MYAKAIRHKICIDFGVKAVDGFGMFAVIAAHLAAPISQWHRFIKPDDSGFET